MSEALILRLDSPLMSFGGVAIDSLGVTWSMPGRAMLTGLIGNALGYTHAESDALQSLQRSLRFSARRDRAGVEITDFQTVDLSQEFMSDGWTTRDALEGREGGTASKGTHIRRRSFLADALYTVALRVASPRDASTLDPIESALRRPKRPLFIGRKCCIPSAPLIVERTSGNSMLDVLRSVPRPERCDSGKLLARWPADEDADESGSRLLPVTDDRDWTNQIHVGRRWVREGWIDV